MVLLPKVARTPSMSTTMREGLVSVNSLCWAMPSASIKMRTAPPETWVRTEFSNFAGFSAALDGWASVFTLVAPDECVSALALATLAGCDSDFTLTGSDLLSFLGATAPADEFSDFEGAALAVLLSGFIATG